MTAISVAILCAQPELDGWNKRYVYSGVMPSIQASPFIIHICVHV
jgi:hypothetical protein